MTIEQRREYNQLWRDKHRARLRVQQRANYAKNRDKILAGINARNAKNRVAVSARLRANQHRRAGIVPTRSCPELCESCNRKPKIALCADHDHLTGLFRGWICGSCNRSIGQLGDTVVGVMRAVDYLKRAYAK